MLDLAFLAGVLNSCNAVVHHRSVEKEGQKFPIVEDPEDASELPLLSINSFVQDLGGGQRLVEAEWAPDRAYGQRPELEALATPPVEFSITLPPNFQDGQPVFVQGPHGRIQVDLPVDAMPGKPLKYRLAPPPEFRIQVPPGMMAGSVIKFNREDGVPISVHVPEGLRPGDSFDVTPPVLMVRVPAGAKPGQPVVFRDPDSDYSGWVRAVVPEGVEPGCYFAARLPAPRRPRSGM